MSNRIQALAQQLTGKKSIDDCSIDELQHMVQRHPFYAPAQFLLLQKLRQSGTAAQAEAQYRKAVLFYHDPLLFEHFISSNQFYVEEMATDTETEVGKEVGLIPVEENQEDIHVEEETNEHEPLTTNEISETVSNEEVPHLIKATDFQETTFGPADETAVTEESSYEVPIQSLEPAEIIIEETTATLEEQPAVVLIESEGEKEVNTQEEEKQKELPSTAPALTFEPFHTVDYFASQGIKITGEEVPKDKLGKQLKSFTEWLKTMKRLPASQIGETVETSAEKKVETLANHSVSESNVVTEAMAEVWLKQGNHEKALDIYNKLSLLNPSKKAYFAAKIENLKLS